METLKIKNNYFELEITVDKICPITNVNDNNISEVTFDPVIAKLIDDITDKFAPSSKSAEIKLYKK